MERDDYYGGGDPDGLFNLAGLLYLSLINVVETYPMRVCSPLNYSNICF